MARLSQKLRKAERLLAEGKQALIEAAAENDKLSYRDQLGGMELATAIDAVSTAFREIGYAKQRNGYGQPR